MKYRNLLLFALMLFLVMAIKYALAQNENDLGSWYDNEYEDPAESIFGLMMAAPILGAVFGGLRILFQRSARPILQPISLK